MARQIRPGQLQENVLYNISASFAISASHEITHEVSSSYAETASFAVTASHLLNNPPPFPFTGSALITGSLVVNSNSTSETLRITQTGTGDAIRIEDSSNPDSTPTVITKDGDMFIGSSSAVTTVSGLSPKLYIKNGSSGYTGNLAIDTAMLFEGSSATYFGTLSPDNVVSGLYMGSPSDVFGSVIRWGYDAGNLQLMAASVGHGITFQVGNKTLPSLSIIPNISSTSDYNATVQVTGSVTVSGSGFIGSGAGLTDIPASGIVGLNLSQIASGSATASISPDKGLHVNTDIDISGSLTVSASSHRIEGSTVIFSTGTPGLTIQSNSDTGEEVKIYDGRIDVEDSGYMAARLSSNAYGSRAGVLDLRHWAGNVGAVITAQPSYTSYIQSSLLIGKTGTVNSSYAYKLDVNGDIKLGNGTDDSIEILGPVTASADISSSAASTASFGTYLGDGSQLTGISTTPFPFSGSAIITGSLTVSQSVVDFTSASAVLLNIESIPLVNPQVEYVDVAAITSSGTTITLPNSLTYVSSSVYEYLEVFINGLRLRYNHDFIPMSNTSIKYELSIPSGSEVTYKSLKRP